jgi:hypothetical protein
MLHFYFGLFLILSIIECHPAAIVGTIGVLRLLPIFLDNHFCTAICPIVLAIHSGDLPVDSAIEAKLCLD